RLPSAIRTAFVLCELQGVRPADAAKQLGCTPNAVAGRLSKARRRLLDQLARKGIPPAVVAGLVGVGATTCSAVFPPRLAETIGSLPHADPAALPSEILKTAAEVVSMIPARTKLLVATAVAVGGIVFGLGVAG